jgi:hypothetical protein
VDGLAQQIQMDLVDMSKFSHKNKGNRWILTVIEVLSRYAFAVPVWRKNTESMTKAVENVLAQFKERFGRYPKTAQFDDGKELYNVGVKMLLRIMMFTTFPQGPSARPHLSKDSIGL